MKLQVDRQAIVAIVFILGGLIGGFYVVSLFL